MCTLRQRLRQLFLLALECGGLRGPQSITALTSPVCPLLPSRPPSPAPASLQLISAPQAVVTTHHIMTKSREAETVAPPPPPGPTRSPPSHLGLKLALRGATRRKCKANSFFLSGLHLAVSLPLSHSVPLSYSHPLCLLLYPPPLPRGPT